MWFCLLCLKLDEFNICIIIEHVSVFPLCPLVLLMAESGNLASLEQMVRPKCEILIFHKYIYAHQFLAQKIKYVMWLSEVKC